MNLDAIVTKEVSNMKKAINDYRNSINESMPDLLKKLELAKKFEGSSLAELFKNNLESIVNEIEKINAHLDILDKNLIEEKQEDNEPDKSVEGVVEEENSTDVVLTPVELEENK